MRKSFLLIVLLLFISSCKKEDNPVEAEEAKYGTISGRVIESATGNIVSKVSIKTEPSTSTLLSDDNGVFKIENVLPGEYLISAVKSGYDTSSATIQVNAGSISQADIILSRPDSSILVKTGKIKGKVLELASNHPIQNVVITTTPATSSITTDPEGLFLIDNVNPGSYTVSAKKNGYESATATIVVLKGLTATANMILKAMDTSSTVTPGSVEGIVRDGITGTAIEGVNISTDPATSTVTTDAEGKYSIGKITPGKIKVTASKSGYTPVTLNVNIASSAAATANFELVSTTGIIKGNVTDAATGLVIAGVNIKTTPGTSTVTTDTTGNYQILNVTPGNFTVTAEKNGYQNGSVSITVKAGMATTADIVLKK